MFIEWFGFVVTMVLVITSVAIIILSIKRKEPVHRNMAIMILLIVFVLCPIRYEKDILVNYEFSAFDTHGRLDYISPFTGEEESREIKDLHTYNELRKHNHMRMRRTYTLLFPLGESFILD
jgi:amino acid permease